MLEYAYCQDIQPSQPHTAIYTSKDLTDWDSIKNGVMQIQYDAVGDLATDKNILEKYFNSTSSTIALLFNGKLPSSDTLIGYSLAVPIDIIYPQRVSERGETAYIAQTAIRKECQGKGFIGPLKDALEHELKNKGFLYMESHAMEDNGYAASIERHYQGRIVKQYSEFSKALQRPQIFFRIKL